MGASSDLCQPFRPRKKVGLGWRKNRLSRYDIRAEGALPLSISVIARLKYLGYGIRNELLMKVNVALILNECFRNIKQSQAL